MQNRVVVVGLGSMGKRRLRCLRTLGYTNAHVYDTNIERLTLEMEGIKLTPLDKQDLLKCEFDVAFVCTPPDKHLEYLKLFAGNEVPTFVEASVILEGLDEVKKISDRNNTLISPSITLVFHPAIDLINQIVSQKVLGEVSSFTYNSGQYLPYWHKYEHVKDYYVSKPETGGAREIVPFELGWMSRVFGMPLGCFGMVRKTTTIEGAESIDDTYGVALDYGSYVGYMNVNVVSEVSQRSLNVIFSAGNMVWNWEDDYVSVFKRGDTDWQKIPFEKGASAEGYDKNISESMYVNEVSSFLSCINNQSDFPNTLTKDIKMLEVLQAIEDSSGNKKYFEISK